MIKTKRFDAADCLETEQDVAAYLEVRIEEALQENDMTILLSAIGTAAKARGMMQVAKDAGVSRESLYKSLAPDAKPRFETISKVLKALGVQMVLKPIEKSSVAA